MYKETTIRQIGNSLGVTIPKSLLERYHLGNGDKVYLVETEDGLKLVANDPGFACGMELYREGAKAYRNAMRELSSR